MASFTMCELCLAEYQDPGNRRFHAQPNACPVCGPQARLLWSKANERANELLCSEANEGAGECLQSLVGRGSPPSAEDPVRAAARALWEGLIVAVKGLGGYHLACRADRPEVVQALRERKHREDRPFGLMAHYVEAAEALVRLS